MTKMSATEQWSEFEETAKRSNVDETLIAQQLRLTPEQRFAQMESMYEWGRELAEAGARARGELV